MTGGIIAGTMSAGAMTGGAITVITIAEATASGPLATRIQAPTRHSGTNTTIDEVKIHVSTQDL